MVRKVFPRNEAFKLVIATPVKCHLYKGIQQVKQFNYPCQNTIGIAHFFKDVNTSVFTFI